VSSQTDIPSTLHPPAFASILCGVDGSRQSLEAARQAAILAGGEAAVTYVAVTWEQGVGATAVATLSRQRAQESLRRARDAARNLAVDPVLVEDASDDAAQRLLELAPAHDLLVIGIHTRSRASGILVGETAASIVHRSPVPVLVSRRPPAGAEFAQEILLAVDGSPQAHAATHVAARLARRHGSRVTIVADPSRDAAHRRSLAEDAAEIVGATGREPVILDEHGVPHRAIAHAAGEMDASLVVCGSRGLHGLAALHSVSERIAQAAPCSVLIVRPRREDR
jgi:nucleotide-binding universal stress UspA family protein